MSTYTLKSMARRGSMLGAALAVLVATFVPAGAAFADSLNPLTERSLLLSSSAPGYIDTDGSGNSNSLPNSIGENYAPAGSGPNGRKTGETFTFKVSTDSVADSRPIKAFTLQYCTSAAGKCQAPGNNTGDARTVYPASGLPNDPANSDSSLWPARVGGSDRGTDSATNETSDLNVVFSSPTQGTGANDDYQVFLNGAPVGGVAWTVAAKNVEDLTHSGELSGANNFITLSTTSTAFAPEGGDTVTIKFFASEQNYITNPGDDSFFVKINTYDSNVTGDHIPATPAISNTHIIDGGVTVANVMTDSIHITTKVLETMSFSVGTQNRDTVATTHGTCDNILQPDDNRLQLGNPDAEYSLETDKAYDVFSYWRLSSNSSGGATVYYSGNTLANTVGDEIAEIGSTAAESLPGTEQFGLAFVDAGADDFDSAFDTAVAAPDSRYKYPTLLLSSSPDVYLAPEAAYADGEGLIDPDAVGAKAKFAFEKSSNTVPVVIAQNNDTVISCATAKMRYVANIGADTPAGVYTTKINYLAAPQY